jgi:hypothetical protein
MAQVLDTRIDTLSDEEEVTLHHNLERQNLVEQVEAHARKPSCRRNLCKGIVLSVAGVLFILMMIQLWTDYGSYIQTRAFPPKIYSMGTYCKYNSTEQDVYNKLECEYESTTLICKVEKPDKVFVQACPHSNLSWDEMGLTITPYSASGCIELVIWSI